MPNGIIIIDKPQGWTSMDVCAKLRGMFHEKRVGHAGTLDPMATGVLPVFIGRATRAVEFAAGSDKEYIAGLKLGVVTNTQDTTGEVLEQRPVAAEREDVVRVLSQFTGLIEQLPPMYSAIKINGKKLYELARKGQEVERKPRPVTIHALEILDQAPAQETDYLIRVACSKGTYVRTLCHDIGQALGCGGCMSSLQRVKAAGFTLADSVTLEAVQEAVDRGEGESLLLLLDDRGICASSGSACTSGSLDPSHVLLALGMPHEIAHGSLRLTVSAENTMEEMDLVVDRIKEIVGKLRDMSPLYEDFMRKQGSF